MYSTWVEVGQVCEKNQRRETAVGVTRRDYHKEICFDWIPQPLDLQTCDI